MMVTHGLALRLFLMRWLHWTVDEFLQVSSCKRFCSCVGHNLLHRV